MQSESDRVASFDDANFVRWLVARHAALQSLLAAHMRDHSELLTNILFGDITRHYEVCCETGRTEEAAALANDLEFALLRADEYVDNVIHVSFLENLGHQRDRTAWQLLPPRLKAGFDMIHGLESRP